MRTPDHNAHKAPPDHDNSNMKSPPDTTTKITWNKLCNLTLEKINNSREKYFKNKNVNKLPIVNKFKTTKDLLVVTPNRKLIKNPQPPHFTLNKLRWLY